jgi:hypothetical protein
VAHGFILVEGIFTRLDFSLPGIPDVAGTEVLGINNLGEIVGVYTRLSEPGRTAGFIGKPAGPEFVYVTNLNSNNVCGYTTDPTTRALTAIAGSPFAAGSSPNSVAVARPH